MELANDLSKCKRSVHCLQIPKHQRLLHLTWLGSAILPIIKAPGSNSQTGNSTIDSQNTTWWAVYAQHI